ncbi:MAG: DUF4760 domain-containing protein [Beijerinckiaceae bacterium]|nr:DUF4760 domain-containing protein [Beijerinckiaceae bacterium]MCZ8301937.1 DUF4760 domain-containing protein [Beijerinckiaceae bacterium]
MTLIEFGRDYAPFIQAGGVVFSAAAAGLYAYVQVRANRRIARERATLDLLIKREWDKDYLDHKAHFNRLRDAEGGLEKWMCVEHRNSDEANSIRYIMNDYELIALAISRGVIDEVIYKAWFRGSMIRDFRAAEIAISRARTLANSARIYVEWEQLAQTWQAE